MPRYLSVGAVRAEGRALPCIAPGQTAPAAPEGMCLVAVVHNGSWQVALDVTHPPALARVQRLRRDGVWHAMSLFALDAARAGQIEDARRVLLDGRPVQDPGRRLQEASLQG